MSNGPKFTRFIVPVIEALNELGGSGRPSEVRELIVNRLRVSESEQSALLPGGAPKFDNEVGWARFYLVKAGYLSSSERGVWRLTEKGQNCDPHTLNPMDIFREGRTAVIADGESEQEGDGEDTIGTSAPTVTSSIQISYRDRLLDVLRSLPPEGFERLCQRLLRESGFQSVTVTGRSGDGGIDGIGVLQINPLVSLKVLFQCKRYTRAVTPSEMRDFRGAMSGRADKGIFLTTGTFTSEAAKEAVRDGVPPIELVDWEKLIEMFERLEMGLRPKKVYEVDSDFFKEYERP